MADGLSLRSEQERLSTALGKQCVML
jgi:hypothetical protein